MTPWGRARVAVTAAAERVTAVAADTRASVLGAVVLALAALGTALLALVITMRRRPAA